MAGLLYAPSAHAPWTFLALSVLVGGLAGWATGRSLALTWRPFWHAAPYALALAFCVAFLHWVLFQEQTLPLMRLLEALGARDMAAAGRALRHLAVIWAIVLAAAFAGYRLMRGSQMRRQYPFERF